MKNIYKKQILFLTIIMFISTQIALYGQIKTINKIKSFESIKELKLEKLNGEMKPLHKFMNEQGLIIIFSSNKCPFVIAWENRYNEIYEIASKHNINMILVNSNEAFRKDVESREEMKLHSEKMKYKMPYLVDNNHKLADVLDARTTPHVFILRKNYTLIYKGAIDDNFKDKSKVSKKYVIDIIKDLQNMSNTKKYKETKALGCSIKR